MKDKEKQVEEMARELLNACAWRFGRPNDYKEVFNDIAEYLAEQGYRKLPEDSVVLSREEFKQLLDNNIRVDIEYLEQQLAQASKETAEKFYEFAKAWFENDSQNDYFEEVKELAKQFGVEIKE